MFIIIKYGDNQEFLVNPNCTITILLHYLRKKLGLRKTDTIDLCDESGTLKMFFLSKTPGDYANKFLTARNIYHVCKVQRQFPGTKLENPYKTIVPLVRYPTLELLESLRTQCNFLETSRMRMVRALEAKRRLAAIASRNLQIKASKSLMSTNIKKSKSRKFDGSRTPPPRGPYYKTREDFLKKHRRR